LGFILEIPQTETGRILVEEFEDLKERKLGTENRAKDRLFDGVAGQDPCCLFGWQVGSCQGLNSSLSVIVVKIELMTVGTVFSCGCRKAKLPEAELELLQLVEASAGKPRVSCWEVDMLVSGEEVVQSARLTHIIDVLRLDFDFWCANRWCSFADTGRITFDDARLSRVNFGVVV
jgi:hypothetical protein